MELVSEAGLAFEFEDQVRMDEESVIFFSERLEQQWVNVLSQSKIAIGVYEYFRLLHCSGRVQTVVKAS